MIRFVPLCASIAAVVGLVVACSPDRIVLATVETEQSDAGTIMQHAPRCTTTADCAAVPGTYCERFACDHTAGKCLPVPIVCPNKEDPSCGEDGVTYFNDCYRKIGKASCSTDGECFDNAATCDSNGVGCQAKNGQLCAQLGAFGDVSSCHTFFGHCWVLPPFCPTDGGDDRWDECLSDDLPDGGTALKCQDTCNAIRSGHTFVRAQTCQ